MSTNSGPGHGGHGGHGGGPQQQPQQPPPTSDKSTAVINQLKRELEESNRKLGETSANLKSLTAQQNKTVSSLEAESKRSQQLKAELDAKESRIRELMKQVDEYKKLVEESAGNHSDMIRVARVKNRVENSALVLGAVSVPLGFVLSRAMDQSSGAGAAMGLAASSAGAATLLTAAAMKAVSVVGRPKQRGVDSGSGNRTSAGRPS